MSYRETCILLPCHSLEDFPMHHEGADADGLLAAWTALWHPALLAATDRAPAWYHAATPPDEVAERLIVVPEVSCDQLPAGYADRIRHEGGQLVSGNLSRQDVLAQVLPAVVAQQEKLDPQLAADFLALGYAFLQVELLTRQMRYATNLDETYFFNQAVAGAVAASQGDSQLAEDKLIACLDLLSQERDNYYAVDAYVLDLALLDPRAMGRALGELVGSEVPINLLVTGQLARDLAGDAELLAAVRQGLEQGHVGLMGGDDQALPSLLLHCETLLKQLQLGQATIERILGQRPHVYGRHRYGMTPLLPQLLTRLGYEGVLHATLDGGRVPDGSQIKMRWEGISQTTIDAVGRAPMDAARPETFLSYASKLGETMDMDHIATLCLAHWPGAASPWYEDLRRIARRSSLLGKFVTAAQYFRDSEYPTQLDQFQADQYQTPYLSQAVLHGQLDPISRYVRYWHDGARLEAATSLDTLVALVQGRPAAEAEQIGQLADQRDCALQEPDPSVDDQQVPAAQQAAARRFAECLPRQDASATNGYLVVNPTSTVRRAPVRIAQLDQLPAVASPVYAVAADQGQPHAVVDVPPMGFVWLTGAQQPPGRSAQAAQPLAEGHRLYNEFFEAYIDPETGGLKGLYQYEVRGNRLSQQLAHRAARRQARRHPSNRSGYSRMRAKQVRVTAATPVLGEITSEGQLINQAGEPLAEFRQVYQVWRGLRVLRLHIELQPQAELTEDPWQSYYACRLAWASEAASLWRGTHQLRQRAEAKRLEAPSYIEIEDGQHRTTLLTGGLPFHRRSGPRMLDSLLIVRGERARSFQLGIGVDVKHPVQESTALLAPPVAVHQMAPPPSSGQSGWLLHLDSRNVVATHWSPKVEAGEVVGVRARLLETLGRSTHARLRCFRPVQSAEQLDFTGQSLGALERSEDAVHLHLEANDWMEVELRWS